MAIIAKINTTGSISRATVKSPTRTAIAAQSFSPKPNVSLGEVNDVSVIGVQNGFTLLYNSSTSKFEAQPIANVAVDLKQITGGTF
jgi:hypothetical protein